MHTVISDLICLERYEILIQITTNIGQLQKWSSFDLCLGRKKTKQNIMALQTKKQRNFYSFSLVVLSLK